MMILGLLDRIVFACGVILFLQLPTFIDQYTHRLGGFQRAQAEQIDGFRKIASDNFNGNMQALINTFENSDMQSVRDTAQNIRNSLQTREAVEADLSILESGNLTKKIIYLLTNLRYNLAQDTMKNFTPNIPLNLQSLLYGLLGGILFSILFFLLIRLPFQWVGSRFTGRRTVSI